ncbi:MAG: hypothetical protein AAB724_01580, partial [Patescibacteria group bacterium]
MKKLLVVAVSIFIIFSVIGQAVVLAAEDDYQARPGIFGVRIVYENKAQTTPEYRYICKIFKKELGQILSRRPLNLPERFFKVHIQESLKEPGGDEPIITVSLDDQP